MKLQWDHGFEITHKLLGELDSYLAVSVVLRESFRSSARADQPSLQVATHPLDVPRLIRVRRRANLACNHPTRALPVWYY
jgi:hypothetical protein